MRINFYSFCSFFIFLFFWLISVMEVSFWLTILFYCLLWASCFMMFFISSLCYLDFSLLSWYNFDCFFFPMLIKFRYEAEDERAD